MKEEDLDFESIMAGWEYGVYSLTGQKAAVCHLLVSILVQKHLKDVRKKKQASFQVEYLDKASALIRSAISTPDSSVSTFDITLAAFTWLAVLEDVLSTGSVKSIGRKYLYLEAVTAIVNDLDEILEGENFTDYFDDISFNKLDWPGSLKAEALVGEYMDKIQEEREAEEAAEDMDPYYLPDFCEHSWKSTSHLLKDLPMEEGLVFHALALLLCKKCLDKKIYSKYQKAVLKAVSTYNGAYNQMQKEFTLGSADDAFIKLKDKVLDLLDELYDETESEFLFDQYEFDVFTIATDNCLSYISQLDSQQTDQILNDITLDSENFYVSDKLDSLTQKFYDEAFELVETMLNDEDDDEDMDDDDYDEDDYDEEVDNTAAAGEGLGKNLNDGKAGKPVKDALSEVSGVIEGFDIDHDVFFHLVFNILVIHFHLTMGEIDQYHEAVNKLVQVYNGESFNNVIAAARNNADTLALKLIKNLAQLIKTGSENYSAAGAGVTNVAFALDMLLQELPTIETELLSSSLKHIDYNAQNDEYFTDASLAFCSKYCILVHQKFYDELLKRKEHEDAADDLD